MANEWGAQLDSLLDEYDDKLRAIEQRKHQVESDRRQFLDDFAVLRDEVIRPLFQAAGAALQRHGRAFRIVEEEYSLEAAGKTTESSIAFHVLSAAAAADALAAKPLASLSFQTRHYSKTVSIGGRDGMVSPDRTAGPRGDYQLAQINAELVKSELLHLFTALVSR